LKEKEEGRVSPLLSGVKGGETTARVIALDGKGKRRGDKLLVHVNREFGNFQHVRKGGRKGGMLHHSALNENWGLDIPNSCGGRKEKRCVKVWRKKTLSHFCGGKKKRRKDSRTHLPYEGQCQREAV